MFLHYTCCRAHRSIERSRMPIYSAREAAGAATESRGWRSGLFGMSGLHFWRGRPLQTRAGNRGLSLLSRKKTLPSIAVYELPFRDPVTPNEYPFRMYARTREKRLSPPKATFPIRFRNKRAVDAAYTPAPGLRRREFGTGLFFWFVHLHKNVDACEYIKQHAK